MEIPTSEKSSEPVIELAGLRVQLGGREILRGLDCRLGEAGRGKAIGLLGPNGSGKSTTGLIVLGLEPPDRGLVRFYGKPMAVPATAAWSATLGSRPNRRRIKCASPRAR